MNPVQQQVLEFHKTGGHVVNTQPNLVDFETMVLRVRFIEEEVAELLEAMALGYIHEIAKELADLLYVVYGTAISYGLDMEPISAEVHRSNMTKFGKPGEYEATCDETGKSMKDAGGKTLKPSCYEPPDLSFITVGSGKKDLDDVLFGESDEMLFSKQPVRSCVICGHQEVNSKGECRLCIDWKKHVCRFVDRNETQL